MDQLDDKGRKLVSFYASGGRVKRKKQDDDCFKKGGPVKKAKGGLPMPAAPSNPMEGRTSTGVVARKPRGRTRMPTIGAPMTGALGRVLG